MKLAILQIGREYLEQYPGYFLGDPVPPEKYQVVWEGAVEDYPDLAIAQERGGANMLLEAVFRRFNLNHPDDYMGWSLSVGDVVRLGDRYYKCMSIGFLEVTDLFPRGG